MYAVHFTRICPEARIPHRAYDGDACFDLAAVKERLLQPSEFACIPTGICIELPLDTEAQIRPRSGLAAKYGVTVLNAPGTIDSGYRGEITVIMINHGKQPFKITPGMRIAQIIVQPIYKTTFHEVLMLPSSERNGNGFGSSG